MKKVTTTRISFTKDEIKDMMSEKFERPVRIAFLMTDGGSSYESNRAVSGIIVTYEEDVSDSN